MHVLKSSKLYKGRSTFCTQRTYPANCLATALQDTHKNYLGLCSVDPACIGCSDMRKSYKKDYTCMHGLELEVDML